MTSKEILDRLEVLNGVVQEALEARTKFLDDHMSLFAEFPVGERVYNVRTKETGTVTEHYRFWAEQNELHDVSFDVEYIIRLDVSGQCCIRTIYPHPWIKATQKEDAALLQRKAML